MPRCLPEDNAPTEPSDSRRSWLKVSQLAYEQATPTPPPPEGVTVTLSSADPTIVPTLLAAIVTATLSEAREEDTILTMTSENGAVVIEPNPLTITAGNLSGEFSVSALESSEPNPFNADVSGAGVTSAGPIQLEFVEG